MRAPLLLGLLLLASVAAGQDAAQSTYVNITYINVSNGTSDTFNIPLATLINRSHINSTEANSTWDSSGDFNAGTPTNTTVASGTLTFTYAIQSVSSPPNTRDPNGTLSVNVSNQSVNFTGIDPGEDAVANWPIVPINGDWTWDFEMWKQIGGGDNRAVIVLCTQNGSVNVSSTQLCQGMSFNGNGQACAAEYVNASRIASSCTPATLHTGKRWIRVQRMSGILHVRVYTSATNRANDVAENAATVGLTYTNNTATMVRAMAIGNALAGEDGAGSIIGSTEQHLYNNSTDMWNNGSASNTTTGAWASEVRDSGVNGQSYVNLTVYGGLINESQNWSIRASNTNFLSSADTPAYISLGTNRSVYNTTARGRYVQVRVNFTNATATVTRIDINAGENRNITVNSGSATGFSTGNTSLATGLWATGNNTITFSGANLSTWTSRLIVSSDAAYEMTVTDRPGYVRKNVTMRTNGNATYLLFHLPNRSSHTRFNVTINATETWNYSLGCTAQVNFSCARSGSNFVFNFTTAVIGNGSLNPLSNGSDVRILADYLTMNFTAVDEANLTVLNTFTVQEIGGNSNSSGTGGTAVWFWGTSLINGGEDSTDFRYTKTGYSTRDFNMASNIQTNFTAALLTASDGANIVFQVVNQQSAVIPGVSVVAIRATNNQSIGSGLTDGTGSIRFFLDPASLYTITFSGTGLETVVLSIQPTQSFYLVRMSGTAVLTRLPRSDVQINWTPSTTYLLRNNSQTIRLSVSSVNCSIVNYTLTATYRGALQTTSGSTACGGALALALNLSNATGSDRVASTISVYATNDRGEVFRHQDRRIYVLHTITSTGRLQAFATTARLVGGPVFLNIAYMLGALGLSMALAVRLPIGLMGAGWVFVGIMGIFGVLGMMDLWIPALAAVPVVGLFLLRRG